MVAHMYGKSRPSPSSSSPASPSPKRSRRSADKRVVWMPIADAKASGSRAKGASESAPPSDSWAWRKYGQKPIKGSPYPRGYYRCSSSKGCPARKQVERSHADPAMLVVTYSSEHNHSRLLPPKSNNNNSRAARAASVVARKPVSIPPESDPSDDVLLGEFSGLIYADDQSLLAMPNDFWYSDVGSTSSTSPPDGNLLFGPIFGGDLSLDDCAKSAGDGGGNNGEEEEEVDALFEGLGELSEYSMVFRRSYVDRQMAAGW